MKQTVLVFGAIFGAIAVALGALGAHALKKVLSEAQLQSFEVGVKYQMYHALVLLVIGFFFAFETRLQHLMGWSFIAGTLLFSFSIYFLSMSSLMGANLKFLGPVTPLGGLLMILGWCLLLVQVLRGY